MIIRLVVVLGVALIASGCATGVYPCGTAPFGVIYTDVTTPAVDLAVETDSAARPTKIGEATAKGICGIATGDCGIDAAMKDGRITKIHHVDHQTVQFLYMVYTKDTTIVYGE